MDNRILIALQFWEGDKKNALELARFIADLEPVRCSQADFLFSLRFDCKIEKAPVEYVAKKFKTFVATSRRRGTGWPWGCNDLWFGTMEWIEGMKRLKRIPDYKAIFTCEADGCPIQRDWIARLSSEWDRVNKPTKVFIAGALVEPGPHINGNALVSGDMKFLNWATRKVAARSLFGGWDYVLRESFRRSGWADIPGIKSIYNTPTFSREQYADMVKNGWVWIHGVKDLSLLTYGRERFGV